MQNSGVPSKLFFRIGEVANIVGVEPHVIRYWESEFRSVRPQKSSKGQRVYSRRDLDTLVKVKDLLYTHKFTIAGARQKLRDKTSIELVEVDASTNTALTALSDIRNECMSLLNELDQF